MANANYSRAINSPDAGEAVPMVQIGTIMGVKDGRATVQTATVLHGRAVIARDCELLTAGSSGGGIGFDYVGSPCLLIRTYDAIEDTQSSSVVAEGGHYTVRSTKCIPLSNQRLQQIPFGFSSGGSFYAGVLNVTKHGITISDTEGIINATFNDTVIAFGHGKASLKIDAEKAAFCINDAKDKPVGQVHLGGKDEGIVVSTKLEEQLEKCSKRIDDIIQALKDYAGMSVNGVTGQCADATTPGLQAANSKMSTALGKITDKEDYSEIQSATVLQATPE